MSTTPTTFEPSLPAYTVVGGQPFAGPGRWSVRVSAVLLARRPRLTLDEAVKALSAAGVGEILSLEPGSLHREGEEPSEDRPLVRTLIPGGPWNLGQALNLAAQEARGDWLLVLWSDQALHEGVFTPKFQKVLAENNGPAVWTPELKDAQGESLPSIQVPVLHRHRVEILGLETGDLTLFPADFTGLYRKETFLKLGGFDPQYRNPFWQGLDFGLRAYLWGEQLRAGPGFRVQYQGEIPPEDRSPGRDLRRFYLKNLALTHEGDQATLRAGRFVPYWLRSGQSPWAAWRSFQEARDWVQRHRFRFVQDARRVVELWETP